MIAEKYLERIGHEYPLMEKELDEFRDNKNSSADNRYKIYEAKNLGHIFHMSTSSLFGFKRKESFVIVPFDIDGPLFCLHLSNGKNISVDFFNVLLDESYDENRTLIIKEKYRTYLRPRNRAQWSDTYRLKSSMIAVFADDKTAQECLDELLEAYLKALDLAHVAISWEKKKRIEEFVEGLINNNDEAVEDFVLKSEPQRKESFLYETVFAVR